MLISSMTIDFLISSPKMPKKDILTLLFLHGILQLDKFEGSDILRNFYFCTKLNKKQKNSEEIRKTRGC